HDRELKVLPRTQHLPAILSADAEGRLRASPVLWNGSADLRGVVDANGLIVVDASGPAPRPGDLVTVHRLPGRPTRAPRVRAGRR
ncbi:MAG TPA: hypothetical protein VEI02_12115, partial [Planctomycetota bacterium]|nr:hypothetical protein [Planctomycetota bacterium]